MGLLPSVRRDSPSASRLARRAHRPRCRRGRRWMPRSGPGPPRSKNEARICQLMIGEEEISVTNYRGDILIGLESDGRWMPRSGPGPPRQGDIRKNINSSHTHTHIDREQHPRHRHTRTRQEQHPQTPKRTPQWLERRYILIGYELDWRVAERLEVAQVHLYRKEARICKSD